MIYSFIGYNDENCFTWHNDYSCFTGHNDYSCFTGHGDYNCFITTMITTVSRETNIITVLHDVLQNAMITAVLNST